MNSHQSPLAEAQGTGTKIALMSGIIIAYALMFVSLYPIVGGGISTLAVLPAVTAGWLFNLQSGTLCGVLMILLNSALFTLLATPSEFELLSAIPSSIAIVASGATVGWLRELLKQVKQQAWELAQERTSLKEQMAKREWAEEALRRAHDELEMRVQERTAELAKVNQALQAEITERVRKEAQIKASLEEKEALLKEIHHRVKNNLQVISSLLNLQSRLVADPQALEVFQESQHRIRSMAFVHEKLYQSESLARIDFAEYVRTLTTYLFSSCGARAQGVTLDIQAEDVLLGIDAAIPCGLILNELVSNALKHAFPNGRDGEVRIDLRADDDQRLTLTVSDDGIGLPEGLDVHNTNSLGLQLVDTLVRQLDGTMEIHGQGGTEFKIDFVVPQAGEVRP
jgi:two-component sensor histidine kinase